MPPSGYVPPHMRRGGGRGVGRSRGGSGGGGGGGLGARRTYSDVVEDAVKSKDAAERKLSKEGSAYAATARDAFLASASDLRAALDENTGGAARHWITHPHAAHDATLALGESLALAAAAGVVASRVGPLTPQLAAAEADAKRRACLLYRDAAAALDELAALGVKSRDQPELPDFQTRQTAVVGAANALAAWGDLLDDPREAAPILERAERRYETAADAELARLNRVEARSTATSASASASFMSASADALAALWNLADARVKRGECAGRLGDAESAKALFDAAFRTYEAACGRADSAAGDDLGGLLHDWGCGLVASAQTFADAARAVKDTDDARSAALCAAAHAALDAAEEKLRHASEFSVGDPAPLNASGEAAQCRAELMLRVPRGGAREVDPVTGAQPAPVQTLEAIDAVLRRATDPSGRGFGAAMRVDAKNYDANVGVAECAAERGRAVVLVLGDAAKAAAHFREAWVRFRAVLEEAARGGEGNGGGTDPGAVADRLGVAYNAACAACRAGEPDAAGGLLASVLACGGCTPAGIQADEDLMGLHPRYWGGAGE